MKNRVYKKKTTISIIATLGLILLLSCNNNKPEIKKTLETNDACRFEWYKTQLVEIDDNGRSLYYYGAESLDGNILIPLERKYSSIQNYEKDGLFYVWKNDCRGLFDRNGDEIISIEKGYTDIEWEPLEARFGRCEKEFYNVKKHGYEGILDLNGKEVIPIERGYSNVYYCQDERNFQIYKNGFAGVCDIEGVEIITPNKYDNIGGDNSCTGGDGYYIVGKNEKFGACDLYGKEVVPPVYDYVWYNDEDCVFKCDNWEWKTPKYIKYDPKKVTPRKSTSSNNEESITSLPSNQPQPRPIQVWKQCFSCQGSGQCHVCFGTGHSITNPNNTCYLCNGTGRCTHCGGQGGHYEMEYQ